MIEIQDYRMFKNDQYNWCIEQKRIVKDGKHKGETVWGNRKYYSKLQQAALALFEKTTSCSEADSIDDLIHCIEKTKNEIIAAL
jgi:hypothetical protein